MRRKGLECSVWDMLVGVDHLLLMREVAREIGLSEVGCSEISLESCCNNTGCSVPF